MCKSEFNLSINGYLGNRLVEVTPSYHSSRNEERKKKEMTRKKKKEKRSKK